MKTYFEQVKEDVLTYLNDEVETTADAYVVEGQEQRDSDDLIEALDDILWIDDAVTGNGSGAYSGGCNDKECVLSNIETVVDACKEWDCIDRFANALAAGEWEWLDVTARCYVLFGAVCEAVEEWAEDNPLS